MIKYQLNCLYIFILLYLSNVCITSSSSSIEKTKNINTTYPNVLIATLVRNKAHTLPYFLSYLENLDYPKEHIILWIRTDHNEDNSIEILNLWTNKTKKYYYDIDFRYNDTSKTYKNKTVLWPKERFEHIINLKEEAFKVARKDWADYIFFLDADAFLTNRTTLKELISFDLPVVAPMLRSTSDYSNFWYEMKINYHFKDSLDYSMIYKRHDIDNFQVPVVHSAILINLKNPKTKWLTFSMENLHSNQLNHEHYTKQYDGPFDDMIIFSMSAKYFEIELYISNLYVYGYLLNPLEEGQNEEYDKLILENIKVQIIYELEEAPLLNKELEKYVEYPAPNKVSFDHIYMINLKRRPERRKNMELLFREMGLLVERFEAVDARELKFDELEEMGVKILPNYEDPMNDRKIKIGEIGCFLSHYKIWQKIVELELKEVLIIEDDVNFFPFFRNNAIYLADQARNTVKWDVLYLGRKALDYENEKWANDEKTLVYPRWTYWTLGYAITLDGAKKLIAAKPLEKILPVDEFIPIMFNQHPNETWKSYFENRNLVALSVYPLILQPAYFIFEERYISDTENSTIIEEINFIENWKVYRDEL